MAQLFVDQRRLAEEVSWLTVAGRVVDVTGLAVVAEGLAAPVGAVCRIDRAHAAPVEAQVVGVRGDRAILMTLQEPLGISAGDGVRTCADGQRVAVGRQMLGTVLDGMGRPIGGRTRFAAERHVPVLNAAPQALSRAPIDGVLATGIRSIDTLLTLGGGQRVGIFAGTGVGKSVLLGMIARYTSADVTVVALVGERGREVGDFLRKDIGEEGMKRCVLVVSTSDESPVLRVRAAFVATAVAEYFRDLGADVLLLMDSTTRVAMAQRQIGLSAGEPPTTKGYPPSVFGLLPRLMERSGRTRAGSITGMYSVLVEGDDLNEPISDAVRGILDGHIVLSRELAHRGHYPAVSVLESVSRIMADVADEEHRRAAADVRQVLAVWKDVEDLVNVGAYVAGASVEFDVAVKMKPAVDEFLRQAIEDHAAWASSREKLLELAQSIRATREQLVSARNP
ncbi:MAG: FliI/YscN family ATPase [Planctomycetes bacterium]|nr:FliI/YscN family ATPase [Planctomycetota bacterium]